MTVETDADPQFPNVFDAGLPILAYEQCDDPEEAHRLVARPASGHPSPWVSTDRSC